MQIRAESTLLLYLIKLLLVVFYNCLVFLRNHFANPRRPNENSHYVSPTDPAFIFWTCVDDPLARSRNEIFVSQMSLYNAAIVTQTRRHLLVCITDAHGPDNVTKFEAGANITPLLLMLLGCLELER